MASHYSDFILQFWFRSDWFCSVWSPTFIIFNIKLSLSRTFCAFKLKHPLFSALTFPFWSPGLFNLQTSGVRYQQGFVNVTCAGVPRYRVCYLANSGQCCEIFIGSWMKCQSVRVCSLLCLLSAGGFMWDLYICFPQAVGVLIQSTGWGSKVVSCLPKLYFWTA